MIEEIKKIVEDSKIMEQDDSQWPEPNDQGKQELIIEFGQKDKKLRSAKIGSFTEVLRSADPKGMEIFYYLVRDLKCLFLSLIGLHFKIKPT